MTGVTDRATTPVPKIIHNVNSHGWHVMKMMPKGQDPGWAFTIGLSRMFETGHQADARRGEHMTRILLVGYDPETVHFSDDVLSNACVGATRPTIEFVLDRLRIARLAQRAEHERVAV
jgi:hypothetical protein